MRTVVTGDLGFIGSQLKKKLESQNHIVFGLDNIYLDKGDWKDVLINFLSSSRPEVVFHVGACSDTLEKNVNYMMKLNYESTKIISDYCAKNKIPLVYSSSAANYGTNNMHPSNLYGWSKYCAEDYVLNKGGVALRYFNVYGPGEHNKGKMASVAYQMFLKKKSHDKVFLFPKGPRRDFVYINDVVSANLHAYENYSQVKENYYHVGSGIAESFEDMMKYMEIQYQYTTEDKIPEGYQFFTCSDKNKWLPNWTPCYNLEKGIKDYKKYLGDYKC